MILRHEHRLFLERLRDSSDPIEAEVGEWALTPRDGSEARRLLLAASEHFWDVEDLLEDMDMTDPKEDEAWIALKTVRAGLKLLEELEQELGDL